GECGLEADQHAYPQWRSVHRRHPQYLRAGARDHVLRRGLADPGKPAELLPERDVLAEWHQPGLDVPSVDAIAADQHRHLRFRAVRVDRVLVQQDLRAAGRREPAGLAEERGISVKVV